MGKSIVEINHKDRRKKVKPREDTKQSRTENTQSTCQETKFQNTLPSSLSLVTCHQRARANRTRSLHVASSLACSDRVRGHERESKPSEAITNTNNKQIGRSPITGARTDDLRADSDCGKPRSPSRLDVTFAVHDFLVLPCHLPAELIRPPCTGARMRMKAVAAGDARDCRVGARLPLCMFMQKWAFLLSCPPCLPCAVVFCTNNDRVREFFVCWDIGLVHWLVGLGWDGMGEPRYLATTAGSDEERCCPMLGIMSAHACLKDARNIR